MPDLKLNNRELQLVFLFPVSSYMLGYSSAVNDSKIISAIFILILIFQTYNFIGWLTSSINKAYYNGRLDMLEDIKDMGDE